MLSHRSRTAMRTMTLITLVVIVILIIAASLLYFTLYYETNTTVFYPLSAFPVESIEITDQANGSSIEGLIYVASTSAEQTQGFQNVTSFGNCKGLSKNQSTQCVGMIFTNLSSKRPCFWMRDTPLPLQQVWISDNGTVVYIYQAQPESDNTVCQNGKSVLETSPDTPVMLGDQVLLKSL